LPWKSHFFLEEIAGFSDLNNSYMHNCMWDLKLCSSEGFVREEGGEDTKEEDSEATKAASCQAASSG